MKKLLIATLTVLSFVSLTACGSGKKLTAEEAKTEVKAAQENTAKALKEKKGLTVKQTTKANANISAKGVKIGEGAFGMEIKSAKLGFDAEESFNATADMAKLNAKLTGDIKANANYSITANGETQKQEYKVSGNGEAYVINGTEKANIYAKGSATLPEKEDIESLLGLASMFNDGASDIAEFIEDLDYKTNMSGKINLFVEKDEDDKDLDPSEIITEIDFDSLIKDWSIFTKKGSTLSADCSNLAAFNIDIDADINEQLAAYGLKFEISKFDISLNKDNEITGFDFKMSLEGNMDLGKIASSTTTDSSSSLFGKISGTVSIDCGFSFGVTVSYADTATEITAPAELTALEEVDADDFLEELFEKIFGGDDDDDDDADLTPTEKAAVTKANDALAAAKTVLLEATATDIDYVTVVGSTYSVTVKDLVANNELESNPFDDAATYTDGGMTVSLNADTNAFSATTTSTIDGCEFIFSNGSFIIFK
ncbi:MAG: hypothetical protein K6E24_00930 [bacterium]|nr:hypothetical protein [bacterium]